MKSLLLTSLLLITLSVCSQTRESVMIYFDFDRYSLTKQATRTIDSLILNAKDKKIGFELTGHCDSRGTNDYNSKLSEKRATAVQNYMVKKGINKESFLVVNGAGELEPLNENNTDEERQLNRRVKIDLVKGEINNDKTLKEAIADSSVIAGSNIVLRNINFVGGMHRFLPESQPMLEELLEAMRSYPALIIQVEGHICCESGPQDGVDQETGLRNLSEARARAVREYLIFNGIEQTRVSYKGFGHSAPLFPYPEKNSEEMKLNRRVEIKIISK